MKMTERYAKLAKQHIARTGNTARDMWKLMEGEFGEHAVGTFECPRIVPQAESECSWSRISALESDGQGRNRTADASLFR